MTLLMAFCDYLGNSLKVFASFLKKLLLCLFLKGLDILLESVCCAFGASQKLDHIKLNAFFLLFSSD